MSDVSNVSNPSGTLAPRGTVFSKYLLESGFRNTFEILVPSGAKGAKGAKSIYKDYICIIICNESRFVNYIWNYNTTSKSILWKRASLSRKIEPV